MQTDTPDDTDGEHEHERPDYEKWWWDIGGEG